MVCIYCSSKTDIVNSRPQKRLGRTWRRHACKTCGAIFTTIEAPDLTASIRFKAPDSPLRPFSRDKLYVSVYEALKHRPDAADAATGLTATIISQLLLGASDGLIERSSVIKAAHIVLDRYDMAAGVQYAAFHRV